MEIKFTVEIDYIGHTYTSSVIIGDDGSVTEDAGEESRQYDTFEDWAGTWSPGNELPKLFPPDRQHELHGMKIRWDNMNPTHLKVGNTVHAVKPKARICETPQPGRRSRTRSEDPNQGHLFKEGA